MVDYDVLIRNAYVQERDQIVEIGITGDRIQTVASNIEGLEQ
jgi:hypothetical protein